MAQWQSESAEREIEDQIMDEAPIRGRRLFQSPPHSGDEEDGMPVITLTAKDPWCDRQSAAWNQDGSDSLQLGQGRQSIDQDLRHMGRTQ